ncbi:hypothetical protein HZA97_07785 [Candidatus Woesearchaeota archaeon]|nr:hypothetical protein [Candidatus Woesearchaeota archaeon]
MKFDEDGKHYFVSPEGVAAADGFDFVNSAWADQDDLEHRMMYITFRDGYLADFASEEVAEELGDCLNEIGGIEDVDWEDRELFCIHYGAKISPEELIKKIDQRVTELSQEV